MLRVEVAVRASRPTRSSASDNSPSAAGQTSLAKLSCQLARLRRHLLAPIGPSLGHGPQHLIESRHPHPRGRGPIGAAKKRFQTGRQEYRHRPATPSGEDLHRSHVDLI